MIAVEDEEEKKKKKKKILWNYPKEFALSVQDPEHGSLCKSSRA